MGAVKVSTRGDYACRALLSLALHADEPGPTSVRDIAERTGLPQPYLEQILLALKGAGLVRSKRGVGGGYVLARDPAEITPVARSCRRVDGPIALGDFGEPHQDGACDHEGQCVLLAVWDVAGDHMRHHLEGYTLATVAAMARGDAPWPAIDRRHLTRVFPPRSGSWPRVRPQPDRSRDRIVRDDVRGTLEHIAVVNSNTRRPASCSSFRDDVFGPLGIGGVSPPPGDLDHDIGLEQEVDPGVGPTVAATTWVGGGDLVPVAVVSRRSAASAPRVRQAPRRGAGPGPRGGGPARSATAPADGQSIAASRRCSGCAGGEVDDRAGGRRRTILDVIRAPAPSDGRSERRAAVRWGRVAPSPGPRLETRVGRAGVGLQRLLPDSGGHSPSRTALPGADARHGPAATDAAGRAPARRAAYARVDSLFEPDVVVEASGRLGHASDAQLGKDASPR